MVAFREKRAALNLAPIVSIVCPARTAAPDASATTINVSRKATFVPIGATRECPLFQTTIFCEADASMRRAGVAGRKIAVGAAMNLPVRAPSLTSNADFRRES